MRFCIIVFSCLLLSYMLVFLLIFCLRLRIENQFTRQKNEIYVSRQIMDKVKTNYTYPELNDIFSQQHSNTSHSTKPNINFEGYFKA